MKQLTKTSFQKLKNDLLSELTETRNKLIKSTGVDVYKAPVGLSELENMLIRNGYVCLKNGPKLTESGQVLAKLCGVKL